MFHNTWQVKGVHKKDLVSSLLLLELGKFLPFLKTTKLSKSRCYYETEGVDFYKCREFLIEVWESHRMDIFSYLHKSMMTCANVTRCFSDTTRHLLGTDDWLLGIGYWTLTSLVTHCWSLSWSASLRCFSLSSRSLVMSLVTRFYRKLLTHRFL